MKSQSESQSRRRASSLIIANDHLLMVRLRDPVTFATHLYPPGGRIEDGESPAIAAAREAWEETGFRVRVRPETETVFRYPFTWAGHLWDVTTFFYRADLDEPFRAPRPVIDADYHLGAEWVPLDQVGSEVAFDVEIERAVMEALKPWL